MNPNDASRAKDELERALGTGDPETIAKTILFNAWPLYSAHYELLVSAISALPSAVLDRNPLLQVVHPLTAVLSRTGRATVPVLHPDDIRAMSPGQVDLLTLAQMISCRLTGDETAALGHAKRLGDRIAQTRVDSRDRTDGPLWFYHHQIASTFLSAGDTSRALLELATAGQLARLSVQPDAYRSTLGRTAVAHAVRGSLDDAERALVDASRQPAPTAAHINSSTATEAAAAALISVERMTEDLDEKLAALEPYDSVELTWPFALLARVRALLARNRPDDALEIIRLGSQTHPAQRGSFAADVITSTTVEALAAADDITRARAVLEATATPGVLTRLASVRLALYSGDLDTATRGTRALVADRTSGPGQRAECTLLSAWLEYARTGGLDDHTAVQAARLGMKRDSRRLFASVPDHLIERVRASVPPDLAAGFTAAVYGLAHVDVRPRPQLTKGELRVLEALAAQETTAAMAAAFHVSPNTIKSQLRSLYRKLECTSREEAVQVATRLHLLSGTTSRRTGDGG